MKILISTNTELKTIPPGLPLQNVITFNLMAGSSLFLSGFNDEGRLWFTKRLPPNETIMLDIPLVVDWENKEAQLTKEINALTLENMELRKQLIASPPGIVIPGNGGLQNP